MRGREGDRVMTGRWEGREYVWTCAGCGTVLCATQAPSPEQAKCLGCRADEEMAHAQRLVRDLVRERDEWMARARQAERVNGDMCDRIAELEEQLRAKEGAAA